jgi:hypothetical protein
MHTPLISVALVSIYPILVMIGANLDEVILKDVFYPLVFSLVTSLLLYWLILKLTKDKYKSSLLVMVFILFFYYYGHVFYGNISGLHFNEITIGRHRFFYPLWVLFFLSFAVLIVKSKKSFKSTIIFLNFLSIFLVLIALIPICQSVLNFINNSNTNNVITTNSFLKNNNNSNSSDSQNIYYIVLDGYAAFDTLNDIYDYDNSKFKVSLEEQGFFVAEKSTANHSYTYLSLSSSLNMIYMNWLSEDNEKNKIKLRELGDSYIGNNKVARLLKDNGYKYITFDSGWSTSGSANSVADLNVPCAPISEFGRILLRTTILDPFFLYGGVRKTILCQLETLGDFAKDTNTFVFSHIVAPHPPFVFAADGGKVGMNSGLNPWADKDAFVEQTKFINKKILDTISVIKKNSSVDPIIIIQSDHGPASSGTEEMVDPSAILIRERMRILNAYHVPESIRKKLYDEITPVNSFRIILSELLKIDLPTLDDKNYFTAIQQNKLAFDDVTDIAGYE